jgi:dynein heavy chain
MLAGPTGGGKTTSCNLLVDSPQILGRPLEQREIHAKAMTLTELYGAYTLATGDRKDGFVGKMFSEMAQADQGIERSIIFDRSIDMLCIKNMNDRITMTDGIHFLFEVEDLAQASAATISWWGMVYEQPEDLGWRPLVNGCPTKKPENVQEAFRTRFKATLDRAWETLSKSGKTEVISVVWTLAASPCAIVDGLVKWQERTHHTAGSE